MSERGYKGHEMNIQTEEFEKLVSQALEDIPKEFLDKMENIEIIVENEPTREILKEMGLLGKGTLFGLYQGLPLPHRSIFQVMTFPDRIVIYRNPILRAFRTPHEIIEQVKKTVVHEVAHHFGISDKRLRELGS